MLGVCTVLPPIPIITSLLLRDPVSTLTLWYLPTHWSATFLLYPCWHAVDNNNNVNFQFKKTRTVALFNMQ